MSVSKHKVIAEIDYPESDGEPLAETDFHIKLMIDLRLTLQEFFSAEPSIYVGSGILLYYVEGYLSKSIAPDIFVVRGVGKHLRRTYKLWEEQRAPNVVIEITSAKTKNEDLQWKRQLYAWLSVAEYFIFDPEYKLKPPLRAYRLRGKDYVEEAVTGGRVWSEELGLELVNTGATLRLYHPATGQFLRTPAEEVKARQQAEAALQAEAEARHQAEAELDRLRAELARPKEPTTRKKK